VEYGIGKKITRAKTQSLPTQTRLQIRNSKSEQIRMIETKNSITLGLIPHSLLCKTDPNKSPSFPHAFSGNPGETGTGPPIKTFGGDAFGINSHRYVLIPRSLPRGRSLFQTEPFWISKLEFNSLGLFRISIFRFRVFFRSRLGAIAMLVLGASQRNREAL
jgi:hypothetical protein